VPRPGGFEGLGHRVVLVNPRDSTVPHLVEGRELKLDARAASAPHAHLPTRNENALAGVDVVEVLHVILAEGLEPLPQVLDQAVQSAVAVADVESESYRQRCEPDVRRVGPPERLA